MRDFPHQQRKSPLSLHTLTTPSHRKWEATFKYDLKMAEYFPHVKPF